MINAIPFIGWMLSLFFAVSLAIPFWFLWTLCGYGKVYFYWLPAVYLSPPFWDCVCIFILASIIKAVFVPLLITNSSEAKIEKIKE